MQSLLLQLRAEAQERKLDWADVRAVYAALKEAEWEKRQQPNEVREAAWSMTGCTPGSRPFWRCGFGNRWGRKIARGADHTIVPGYDEITQQIATEFPEYRDDDGERRLWELLFSPHDKLPPAEQLYRKAMEFCECHYRKP